MDRTMPKDADASMRESAESRGSSLLFSESFSDDRLEGLSDEALQTNCDRLRMSVNFIRIENTLFERFAARVDPSILAYVNQALSQYATHHHTSPTGQSSASTIGRKSSIDSVTSIHTTTSKPWHTSSNATRNYSERMAKLSVQQKMDIIVRELELMTTSMEKEEKMWKHSRAIIHAEIEEVTLRLNALKEATQKLEMGFSSEWLDPITGRVPADKFIRFLRKQIHIAEGKIDRCRLKTSTLQVQCVRSKEQLLYKEELGEALCPIDFEQIKIDNAQLKETFQKKNQYLLDLKQIFGKCGPSVAIKKGNLAKILQQYKTLKERITQGEASQFQMEHDAETTEKEVNVALKKYNSLRKLVSGYHAPDVMDYIKKKSQLNELQRRKKSLSRRRQILDKTKSK